MGSKTCLPVIPRAVLQRLRAARRGSRSSPSILPLDMPPKLVIQSFPPLCPALSGKSLCLSDYWPPHVFFFFFANPHLLVAVVHGVVVWLAPFCSPVTMSTLLWVLCVPPTAAIVVCVLCEGGGGGGVVVVVCVCVCFFSLSLSLSFSLSSSSSTQ